MLPTRIPYDMLRNRCPAAVATAFPDATAAGMELLRTGGNAVDAAVAAAWALGVCEPSGSGLGGQTILLLRGANGRSFVIDGHSQAPAAAAPETISAAQQRSGYRACTVPTTPATLDWTQLKYGRTSRERVMAPAIAIAERGYAITRLQSRLARCVAPHLRQSAAADLFLVNGAAPPVGYVLRQPELAATLRRLATHGADEFYRGEMAREIADDMRAHGGLMTERDLADCGPPKQCDAVSTRYRGHRVLTAAPPAGGMQLLAALEVLARMAPAGWSPRSAEWLEALALTTSAVFREQHAGIPEAAAPPRITSLLSAARVRRIAREVGAGLQGAVDGDDSGETTHICVCDAEGNIVLLTQSIQSLFGAKVAHRQLGFLYNNYLRACPRDTSVNGLGPNCRPRSNAAPTLVLDHDGAMGRPLLALGAAGSRRIISSMLQVISGVIDHRMHIASAIAGPRIHGLWGRKVWVERPAASAALLAGLHARGRRPIVKPALSFAMGCVQGLQFFPDGSVVGAADPRRDGTAEGMPE